jgi:hypothetical protein
MDVPCKKPFGTGRRTVPAFTDSLSHDGNAASGGFDQLIHIWDAVTQEKVMTMQAI